MGGKLNNQICLALDASVIAITTQAPPVHRLGQKGWRIKYMDKVPNFKKFIRHNPSQTEIIERMSNIQEEKSLTYRKVANWRIDDRIRNELPSEVRVIPKGGG